MILNVTILEDEITHATQLEQLLKKWSKQNNISISIRHYFNDKDFLGKEYDEDELFFIDIELGFSNGMDIAKQLRKDGFCGNIIFLTAFSEYVFEGYHVQALDYLLKPISWNKLEQCMKPILRNMQGAYHEYRTKTETVKIPYNKILAFTSFHHYVDITTELSDNKTCYRQKITLKNLQNQLPDEFVRCHRTIIININKAIKLTCKDITLSDNSVYPVSESYLDHIREAFSNLFEA